MEAKNKINILLSAEDISLIKKILRFKYIDQNETNGKYKILYFAFEKAEFMRVNN